MYLFLVSTKLGLLSQGREGEIVQLQNLWGKTFLLDLAVYGAVSIYRACLVSVIKLRLDALIYCLKMLLALNVV